MIGGRRARFRLGFYLQLKRLDRAQMKLKLSLGKIFALQKNLFCNPNLGIGFMRPQMARKGPTSSLSVLRISVFRISDDFQVGPKMARKGPI